jgi:hypothetical protein
VISNPVLFPMIHPIDLMDIVGKRTREILMQIKSFQNVKVSMGEIYKF